MKNEGAYILIFLVSVFISSVSQIVLKKSANRKYKNKLREYLNFPVIMSYSLFFASSLLTVLAYKGVPLSKGPILEATGYIWVAVLGRIFLGENLKREKVFGMVMIIVGILLFSMK